MIPHPASYFSNGLCQCIRYVVTCGFHLLFFRYVDQTCDVDYVFAMLCVIFLSNGAPGAAPTSPHRWPPTRITYHTTLHPVPIVDTHVIELIHADVAHEEAQLIGP